MRSKGEYMIFRVRFLLFLLVSCSPAVQGMTQNDDSSLVIREIQIEGNEETKDYIILREMSLSVGDTVTAEAIERDRQRIYNLGLFNRVDVEYTENGGHANVLVTVHERWYIFPFPIIGFRYRDPKKLYYGAGIAHLNFRGRNEKIIFDFALGYDRWAELIYQTPKLTSDDDIFLRASLLTSRVQNLSPTRGFYQQQHYLAGLTLGKRFGFYQMLSAQLTYDEWNVSDPIARGTISPDGKDAFLSFGVSYSYDTRDVREYTTAGEEVSLNASKVGLWNGVNFFRYGYTLSTFLRLTSDLSLGARTHGTFSSGGPVPPYRYVYFGYGERIRGYFNDIFEGENILGGNVELRFPILSPRYYEFPYSPLPEFGLWRYGLYASLFADAGKTWFRSEGFWGRKWYSGFGGGLHFLLPYSIIIRTEYAWKRKGRGQFVLDFGASF